MKNTLKQLACFITVGCGSAATHWLVVVALVSALHIPPLFANILGWLVAFVVSFTGHYQLTFRHQHAPIWQAARRFFLVSALGFAINETSYAVLLTTTTIRYDILLAVILVAIAAMTFILGRFWAFRGAVQQR